MQKVHSAATPKFQHSKRPSLHVRRQERQGLKVDVLVVVIEQIADSETGGGFGIFQDRILRCVLAEK